MGRGQPGPPGPAGPPLRGTTSYDLSVAFSPDGRTLAVGSADKTIHLWDVARPAHPRLGPAAARAGGYVYALAFSPDGQTLAAGVTDNTVWLWHAAEPARPAWPLSSPARRGMCTRWPSARPAGSWRRAARTGPSGCGIPGSMRRPAVCATSGEPLTRSEWVSYDPGRAYQPPCPAGR